MIERNQIFINGTWVDSTTTDVIEVVNPATEDVIATVPRGTPEDVDRAVRAASAAFGDWSQSPIDTRAEVLRNLADLLEERGDEITQLIVSEIGQPVTWAKRASTAVTVQDLRNFADALKDVVWAEQVGNSVVHRRSAGVVGAITAGLAGAVWAADAERARAVAARVRTGRVRINGTPIDMRAPHGGFKLSGIGREMGRHGIEDYLEYQSLHG